jgi:DNA-binding transcriptional MocR family regulator
MIPLALDEACRRHKPKASISFRPSTIRRRSRFRRRARRARGAIRKRDLLLFEDDAYGSLDPKQAPIATLIPERSYLAATLSKCIAPGLRISFLLTPDRAAAALLANALRTVRRCRCR